MSALVKRKWMVLRGLGLAIAGVGSASAGAPQTAQIEISAMAFSAPAAAIRVGDTVEWVNRDSVDHTATEKAGLWSVSTAPGKSATVVMKRAGTFDYYCRYHPNMIARLVVVARAKPAGGS